MVWGFKKSYLFNALDGTEGCILWENSDAASGSENMGCQFSKYVYKVCIFLPQFGIIVEVPL